jgi:lipoate---protein ligase
MLIVERPQTNPYFNIAAEEYLLKHLEEDSFMVWQNDPSVIIGKHQNALAEINLHLVRKLNIPVIRRISGGGTVYHDSGNLNFTFIKHGKPGLLVDFSRFIKPIVVVLNQLGIPAQQEGKNDIRVNGLKISGNSEHVYRDKVLHHGTLLFNSDLTELNEMLRAKPLSFKDKSVQSVRSRVANLSEFLTEPVSMAEFRQRIIDHIIENEKDISFYSLTDTAVEKINDLVTRKYKTWEWNFGYSPDYIFENKIICQDDEYRIYITVKKGVIEKAELIISDRATDSTVFINKLLVGKNHNYDEIKQQILKLNRNKESLNFEPNILLELLF